MRHGRARLLRGEQLPERGLLRRRNVCRQRIGLHGSRAERHLLEWLVPDEWRCRLRRRRPDLLWRHWRRRCERRDGWGRPHDLHRLRRALLGRDLRQLRQPRRHVLRGRGRHGLRVEPLLPSRRRWNDLRAVRRQRGDLLRGRQLRERSRLRQSGGRHAAHVHGLRRDGRRLLSRWRLSGGRRLHGRNDGNGRDLRRLRRSAEACCGGGGFGTCNTGFACLGATGGGAGGGAGGGGTCQSCGSSGQACCGRMCNAGLACAGGGMGGERRPARRVAPKVSRAVVAAAPQAAQLATRGSPARRPTAAARAAVSRSLGDRRSEGSATCSPVALDGGRSDSSLE